MMRHCATRLRENVATAPATERWRELSVPTKVEGSPLLTGSRIIAAARKPTTVQTLIFDPKEFDEAKAVEWAKSHGFSAEKVDKGEDGKSLRLRQREPEEFEEGSFRTVELRPGVKSVVGRLKAEDKSAEEESGRLYEIVIIEAGDSKNDRHYPAETLRAAVPLFEDANVFAHGFGANLNHLPGEVRAEVPEGFSANLIGYLTDCRFAEVDGRPCVVGMLHVADKAARELFKALYAENRPDKLGFSIDAEGVIEEGRVGNRKTRIVRSIERVFSVDLVTAPAAGGRFNRVLAGEAEAESGAGPRKEKVNEMKNKLMALLKRVNPALAESLGSLPEANFASAALAVLEARASEMVSIGGPQEALDAFKKAKALVSENKHDEAIALLDEAVKSLETMLGMSPASEAVRKATEAAVAAATRAAEAVAGKGSAKVDALEKTLNEERVARTKAVVEAAIASSDLPEPMRAKLREETAGKVLTEEEVKAKVSGAKDFLAKLTEAGAINGMGSGDPVVLGQTEMEKLGRSLDLALGYTPKAEEKRFYEGIRPAGSLREMYIRATGDREVRWNRRVLEKRVAEAISTDFPKLLGDSITRRLLQAYGMYPRFWDKVATVVPVNDFRTQRRINWGHFADLAVVAEDAAFTALANPSEKEATYAPQKRGKKFAITREMILADDLRKLRQIPAMLGTAASRTLDKFVSNLLIGNVGGGGVNTDLIYDGAALYTVGKANLGTLALDDTSLRAARVRMKKQKDQGAVETLGLKPKWLMVPIDLGPTARILVKSEKLPGSQNNDINDNFGAAEVIENPYLTDANDWFLMAAKEDLEGLELGFVGGAEEPEVLIQDDPTEGDVFTNERITYKVRHEYGGAITDYRPYDGSIVA